jgi:opacity protein-like surface antigen
VIGTDGFFIGLSADENVKEISAMKTLALAAAAALSMSVAPAFAASDQAQEVGRLECIIHGGVGMIIGSSKKLNCTYTPSDPNIPKEDYVGRVNKIGLDVGVTGKSVMQWLVLAPTKSGYGPGALAGDYTGASAQATAVVGAGANVLVGGSDRTFTLQPISVQTQTGVNVAAGVTSFHLESVLK